MSSSAYRRLVPWLVLFCICTAFVVAVVRVHPTNLFGYGEDDSIYFASAKAIAQGKGYILPSFPFPTAPRYPVLYPWLLSWIWRWNPSFPSNLKDAIALSVAFAVLYIVTIFAFLRGLKGIEDWEALLITGFCALHPMVIFLGGRLVSDFPCAVLMLGAIILAERAVRAKESTGSSVCCGILAGLGILLRVLGVPTAAGIAVSLAFRRTRRQLAIFCASVAPFFGVMAWRIVFPPAAAPPIPVGASTNGAWVRTWAYYTSYAHTWRQAAPNASAFGSMLRHNLIYLLRTPADYFWSPWPVSRSSGGEVLAIVIAVVIVKGMLRLSRESEAWSVPWVLLFYATLIGLWAFADDERFLIPFLPIFAAGLWVECRYVAKMVAATNMMARSSAEKLTAGAFVIAGFVFLGAALMDYAFGLRHEVAQLSEDRALILPEKRQAYEWLAESTDRNARVIACEDASLYLYSGRVAVRALTASGVLQYDRAKIGPEVTDTAQAIGADYWLVAADDHTSDWSERDGQSRPKNLGGDLRLAYKSENGRVRVYWLGCGGDATDSSCESGRNIARSSVADRTAHE